MLCHNKGGWGSAHVSMMTIVDLRFASRTLLRDGLAIVRDFTVK
jgi:hypothetical protein